MKHYNRLIMSVFMWLCVACRENIENNIMMNYEGRISKLEDDIQKKCSIEQVREIVKEKLKLTTKKDATTNVDNIEGITVLSIMGEINERKSRKNNIVIHEIEETHSEYEKGRKNHDIAKIEEIISIFKISTSGDNRIARTTRIGIFNKNDQYF